jgi:hypothetical protein
MKILTKDEQRPGKPRLKDTLQPLCSVFLKNPNVTKDEK